MSEHESNPFRSIGRTLSQIEEQQEELADLFETLGEEYYDDEGTQIYVDSGGSAVRDKDKKPETLGAIDPLALQMLGRVAFMGAEKYARFDYLERPMNWSEAIDALGRHFLSFQAGEDLDPESGLPHPVHVSWNALALVSYMIRGLGNDDRFVQKTPNETTVAAMEAARRGETTSHDSVQGLIDDLNDDTRVARADHLRGYTFRALDLKGYPYGPDHDSLRDARIYAAETTFDGGEARVVDDTGRVVWSKTVDVDNA